MPLGIKFTLTTPVVQNLTIGGFEVTDAVVDYERGEVTIAYDRFDDQGNPIDQQRTITLDGQAAADALARAQTIATNQGVPAHRAQYYVWTEAVRDALGVVGTIDVT